MKLSKREKTLLILVLIIGSAAGYIFLFLQPCLDQINKLDSQNRTNLSTIQNNAVLQESIKIVTEGLIEDEKKLAEFGENVNTAFDQPPVIVYLYRTISEYGFKTMTNFDISKIGNYDRVNFCHVSVTMVGSYDALKSVLREFAEGEYLIKITGLTVKRMMDTSDVSEPEDAEGSEVTEEPLVGGTQLNIGLELDFFNIGKEIPPDRIYDFTDGAVQYGGDIFS